MSRSDGFRGCLAMAAVFLIASSGLAQTGGGAATEPLPMIGAPTSSNPQDAAATAGRNALPQIRAALAEGDWDTARRKMLQLTLFISHSYNLKGLEALEEELANAAETPELLAIGLLLFDVSQEALGEKQYLASTLMRRAGFGCLDRLENTRGVSPALMADVYTLLGAKLQAAGSSNASGDSFRRAVKLDPKLGSARLGLGIYYDQLGHPEDAVNEFDDIPAVQPFQGEAWLRKAVAQIQLGHDRSARRTLGALVDPKAPSQPEPWVQSVAFQELAMLRLRQDGPQAARDVLQQAVKRLSQERRPYLLLAFVHNTLGQRAAAAGVMRDMEKNAQADDEDNSPRHRLAQWRLEIPVGLEDRLRGQAVAAVATGKLGS